MEDKNIKNYLNDQDQLKKDIDSGILKGGEYIKGLRLSFLYTNHKKDLQNYYFILGRWQEFTETFLDQEIKGLLCRGITYSEEIHPFNFDIVYTIDNDKNRLIELIEISENSKITKFNLQNFSNKDVKINNLSLKDYDPENENCVISNIDIENLEISNFSNNSKKFVITNGVIDHLKISDSDLGRMIFNGVEIKKLTLENVTLNDCIFNGCNFPEKLEKIPSMKKQKDNYRQLKHVMDKNGNHTEANNFFAKEMEYYGRTLSFGINKIIYWIQRIVSNFGNNWHLTFLWIIFLGALPSITKVLFLMYYGAYDYKSIFGDIENYKILLDNILSNIVVFSTFITGVQIVTPQHIVYNLFMVYLIYTLIISLKRTTKR